MHAILNVGASRDDIPTLPVEAFLRCAAVDNKVPQALGSFLNCLVNVLGSLAINIIVTPLIVVPLIPMAAVYDAIRRRSGNDAPLLCHIHLLVILLGRSQVFRRLEGRGG